MLYTMKIELLTNDYHYELLTDVMHRFNQACNQISEIGFQTKTHRNKIRLSKECYNFVRDTYDLPSQMVVRAIGKVVEGYKAGSKTQLIFGEKTSVVYDTRQLSFKWMNSVSISTIAGRIEVPFRVEGYRLGTYDRRISGQADLILQDMKYYLLLQVELPEVSNISTIDFTGVTS